VISVAEAHAQLTAPGAPFEMEEAVIRGLRYRVWKSTPKNLRVVFDEMRAHGNKDCVVYEDDRLTFADAVRASSTLAHLLRDRYGVKKGDRVAIAMRNFPEWVVAFWGITTLGAVVVPLNAWWSAEELQYGLEDSGSRVVFADEERAVRLSNVMLRLDLDACIVARARNRLPDGCVAFEELLGSIADYRRLPHDSPPAVELEPEDDATLFYTSGTTGRPKGALGTHRNICINLVSLGFGGARALLRQGQPLPTPDPNAPQRASLLSVPFFHVTGCHSTLLPASRAGSKLVLMYRWDAGEALKLIERERINGIGGVPTMMWQLIQHPDFRNTDLSSVESIGYGGAAAAPELVERLKTEFPQIAGPGQGYGMTETSSIVTSNGGIDYVNKPLSCGPAVPICDIRVVDDRGRDVPHGSVGELWVKGPNIIKEYLNRPEATAEAITDGYMHTGDLVTVDEDSFITIVDRAKDMLIRGGENIYCVEVEAALYTHPDVVEAAVVAVPHKELGEEVGAIVTLRPGAKVDVDGLRLHVREHLAAYKVPKYIELWSQELPKNANGKVLKQELRDVMRRYATG
jgi:long-chain acyl-CoA synthetase